MEKPLTVLNFKIGGLSSYLTAHVMILEDEYIIIMSAYSTIPIYHLSRQSQHAPRIWTL